MWHLSFMHVPLLPLFLSSLVDGGCGTATVPRWSRAILALHLYWETICTVLMPVMNTLYIQVKKEIYIIVYIHAVHFLSASCRHGEVNTEEIGVFPNYSSCSHVIVPVQQLIYPFVLYPVS